jgi:hypothetical protein
MNLAEMTLEDALSRLQADPEGFCKQAFTNDISKAFKGLGDSVRSIPQQTQSNMALGGLLGGGLGGLYGYLSGDDETENRKSNRGSRMLSYGLGGGLLGAGGAAALDSMVSETPAESTPPLIPQIFGGPRGSLTDNMQKIDQVKKQLATATDKEQLDSIMSGLNKDIGEASLGSTTNLASTYPGVGLANVVGGAWLGGKLGERQHRFDPAAAAATLATEGKVMHPHLPPPKPNLMGQLRNNEVYDPQLTKFKNQYGNLDPNRTQFNRPVPGGNRVGRFRGAAKGALYAEIANRVGGAIFNNDWSQWSPLSLFGSGSNNYQLRQHLNNTANAEYLEQAKRFGGN